MSQPAFSDRVQRIKPSPSTAAAALARQLKAEGRDILSLTTGEPDFPTPPHIVEAAAEAMRRGETRYTNVGGTDALKAAVIEKFSAENGLAYEPAEVMASTGAKQIIFNALMATVNEGDEVIVPSPCWVSYPDMAMLAGGEPVIAETRAEDGFLLTAEALERLITPKTRWLVLNSPSNPSGAVYDAAAFQALGEVLARHPRIGVMSDDIYEHIIYDGRRFTAFAAACPELKDRTLTVNGVSKAYAMTGWRLGFCGGPAPLIKEMAKLQSQSTSNPSAIGQAGAIAALTGPKDFLAEMVGAFARRRDLICGRLEAIEGLSCTSPAGAFYAFPSCAGLIGRKTPERKVLESDWDVVRYLLDSVGVATVHGAAFCASPYFRISFATADEVLEEAGERIARACDALS
ncbi:pyridoxal phosphate-dependent aminotransferase [Afifella sp. IM 167]|uniref:pyridoxal phosphate-dependent aminotransferase n=1 Tax=Afifella sp. IM 167 TaxID=2033586 RepID=UPI001CCE3868|nr:pyridoxal phosphate-dependent aminotransferase [Afifella sp. IM 167]MBZ8135411.1 aspartate aminotransferase [Afifella sp. IM 167]